MKLLNVLKHLSDTVWEYEKGNGIRLCGLYQHSGRKLDTVSFGKRGKWHDAAHVRFQLSQNPVGVQ